MSTLEYIMQKYSLTLSKSDLIEIPNIGRHDLATLFAELDFNVGAEVGVMKGEYSELLCWMNPKLKLYSIDSWKAQAGMEYSPQGWNQAILDSFKQEAYGRLKDFNCEIIRSFSMDAVKLFDDNSLDFVYIDANHTFQDTVNDIVEWSKKVRVDGIIAGHDYARYPAHREIHTKYVVDFYTRAMGIRPWFLAGTQGMAQGEVRDKVRSWFWVKT